MNGRIGSDQGVGDFTRMRIGESSACCGYIIASPAMLDMLREFQIYIYVKSYLNPIIDP